MISTPHLTQVTPVSHFGSQGVPTQDPIFIILAGQQPQPTKNGVTTANAHFAQNGTATFMQAPGTGQPLPVLNDAGLPPPLTQLVISPQVNGVVPHKMDIHPTVHHPTMINGQTVIQAPPILVNFNGTTATLMQPNGQPATIMPSQPMIGGGGSNIYYTTNTLPPPLQPTPQIITTAANRTIRTIPAIPLNPQKMQTIVKQKTTPISIRHSSVSERKNTTPPPLMQVKQEVGVVRASEGVTHGVHSLTNAATTTTSPTREHQLKQQQKQHVSLQASPKTIVLPRPLVTEANCFPPSTSPPAQAIYKKSQGVHTSLPYIILDEKQQRQTDRHIILQQPQSSSSGGSNLAQLYGGNCWPTYRFNSTLNNIQPLQIVTAIPAPPPGITLPNFMKRDTRTAH